MASKGGVVVVVSGQDNTGEVFAAVKKHLEDTQAAAKTTSESLGSIGKVLLNGLQAAGITIGLQQIISGFKDMVKSTMEAGVELAHLNEQTGISVENLSVLKYAAATTGVEFETLVKGFKKLSTSIFEAEQGSGAAVKAFAELGISQADLKAKGNDLYGITKLVADKFAEMPDGFKKNALASELFGRAGQQLIPILNQGAAGIERLKAAAPIFSQEDIDKMEQLHKATVALDAAEQNLAKTITGMLAPATAAYLNNFAAGLDVIGEKIKGVMAWLTQKPNYGNFAWGDAKPSAAAAGSTSTSSGAPGPSGSSGGSGSVNPWVTIPLSQTMGEFAAQQADAQIAAFRAQAAANQAGDLADANAVANAAYDKAVAAEAAQTMALFNSVSPHAVLGPQAAKPMNLSGIEPEAEKFAHGVFDPLFEFGEKWDKQWKQIRANMLKDLGQTAESQLFGALFGDPSGRGGKGWNGESHEGDITAGKRTGVAGPAGLVGNLLGLFTKKPGPVSNGIGAAGAGTVPGAAASLMQIGKSAGAGVGGVQVIVNNLGTPTTVDSTQTSGDSAEAMILQIVLKDQQTNGAITQGFSSMFNH